MSILVNQQNLYGMTPLYYMLLDERGRSDFNKIVSYTNIDESVNFINALIEYEDLLRKVYIDQDYTGLTKDQISFLHTNDFVKIMLPTYYGKTGIKDVRHTVGLRYAISELREIKEEGISNFKLEGLNLNIGRLDFDSLIKFNPDVIEEKLKAELYNITVDSYDKDIDYELTQQAVDKFEQFINNLNIAIGLVQKRIDRIENRNKKSLYKSLDSMYSDILVKVEKIDSMMLGEIDGQRNEKAVKVSNLLKENASKIGLDQSTQLYSKMLRHASEVKRLQNVKYNHKIVPMYEAKKKTIEKIRVLATARLDTLTEKHRVSIFYF